MLGNHLSIQTFAQNFTTFKNILRNGGEASLGPLPQPLAFGTAPTLPLANIEGRFRNLLQRITHNSAYTAAIGQDLGIEAPLADAQSKANLAAGKPQFYIELSSGGHPNLRWTKGKYDGVEIWKDSGSGFVKLERDMRPDYIDKTDLPAPGATAIWKYKMIYLKADDVIGQLERRGNGNGAWRSLKPVKNKRSGRNEDKLKGVDNTK